MKRNCRAVYFLRLGALSGIQLVILALLGNELFMVAALNHASML
jgi:hypothetical protein